MDLLRSRINSSEYISHNLSFLSPNLSLLSPGVCLPPCYSILAKTIIFIQTEDDSWHFLFQLVSLHACAWCLVLYYNNRVECFHKVSTGLVNHWKFFLFLFDDPGN